MVEVTILLPPPVQLRYTLRAVLADAPGHLVLPAAEAGDIYLHSKRDRWER